MSLVDDCTEVEGVEMSNTLTIEGQIMYDAIKDIDTPKEALTKLAGLQPSMGWDVHPERARAAAYAIWLSEKKLDAMLAYYDKMLQFFVEIEKGTIDITKFGHLTDAPEGWIAPALYLKGEIPKTTQVLSQDVDKPCKECILKGLEKCDCPNNNLKNSPIQVDNKKVVCDACEKEIEDGDNVTECPHCGAIWCEGCDTFVGTDQWCKDSEYCVDCQVSAAEARHDAMNER